MIKRSAKRAPVRGLRHIPPINSLLDTPVLAPLVARLGRTRVVDALRGELESARAAISSGARAAFDTSDALARVERALLREELTRLRWVVNATGIVIHTNLGRSPLSVDAVAVVAQAASSYSNLEFDLTSGRRGRRADGAEQMLRRLTGAEAAAVVNNNAAAVLLALTVVAGTDGGEVLLSRGEMVEIGGSFRVPDVLRLSGAKLIEVGTTNRTHLRDYEAAITPRTRAILRVHASNYKIVGFTAQASLGDLASLAKSHDLVLMEDLGSGALIDLAAHGLPDEPTPQQAIAAGVDVVTFSGDKLLGGPQAGLIVGTKRWIERMTSHPLYRALRADKMCLAALDATLNAYETGVAHETLPVLQMLTASSETLLCRAEAIAAVVGEIEGLTAKVVPGESFAGGGSLPEMALPTHLARVESSHLSPDRLAERLRTIPAVPVVGVIRDGALNLDARTVRDDEILFLEIAFQDALRAE